MMNESTLLAVFISAVLVASYWAWRHASKFAYYLQMRFRFFALRDRFVALVADGIVMEDDAVFQFFYELSNTLARDARCLDFRSFVRHITRAILLDKDFRSHDFDELMRSVKARPEPFQRAVREFYAAVQLSLLDSSTLLQVAVLLQCLRFTRRMGNFILSSLCASIAFPKVLQHFWETRREVCRAYRTVSSVHPAFAPA